MQNIMTGPTCDFPHLLILRVGNWSPSAWIPPAARINLILIPEGFEPVNTWMIGLPGPDHRAEVADTAYLPFSAPSFGAQLVSE